MKQLFIIFLMMATLKAQVVPDYFCNLADVPADATVAFLTGQRQLGNGCTVAANKKLILDSKTTAPVANGQATAAIEVANFDFVDGSTLWYLGGTAAAMNTAAPIIMAIYNNKFRKNAVIALQGSYPPSSIIEIFNNVWAGQTTSSGVFASLNVAHNIFFYDFPSQVNTLHKDSRMRIYNNEMPIDPSVPSQLSYGVGFNCNFQLNENSILDVSNNIITTKTSSTSMSFCLGFANSGSSLAIGGPNTQFIFSGNQLTPIGESIGMYLPVFNSNGWAFKLNVTNNAINQQSVSAFSINIRGCTGNKNSEIDISNNKVTSTKDARILVTDLTLTDTAVAKINRNVLYSIGGNPVISFGAVATLSGASKTLVEGNDLRRLDSTALQQPSFYFLGTVAISDAAVVDFNHNNIEAQGSEQYLALANVATKAAGSTAKMFFCNNIHYGEIFTAYDSHLGSQLAAIAEARAACPAAQQGKLPSGVSWPVTTTTTTTKATTTTAAPATTTSTTTTTKAATTTTKATTTTTTTRPTTTTTTTTTTTPAPTTTTTTTPEPTTTTTTTEPTTTTEEPTTTTTTTETPEPSTVEVDDNTTLIEATDNATEATSTRQTISATAVTTDPVTTTEQFGNSADGIASHVLPSFGVSGSAVAVGAERSAYFVMASTATVLAVFASLFTAMLL